MCAINENHMTYGSWDMEHNSQNFFVVLDHLLPFYPLNNPENQNYKKWKKPWRLHNLTQISNIMIIWYTVPEMWHLRDVIVIFHLGLFSPLLSLLIARKIKIFKKWKKPLELSSFHTSVTKSWSHTILFLRDGLWQM